MDVVIIMGAWRSENFEKERQATLELVQADKNSNVIYEIIQNGNEAVVIKSLSEKMDKKSFIAFLPSLSWKENGDALLDGVRQAKMSFEKYGRPKATKVLVLFSDDPMSESVPVVKKLGDDLRASGIKMIGILVGNYGEELKITSLVGRKPLKIDNVNSPEKTGRDMAEDVLKGKG